MARRTTLAQLWWVDGRRETRRVDVSVDRVLILAADGRSHTFYVTNFTTDDGAPVFIESGGDWPHEPSGD